MDSITFEHLTDQLAVRLLFHLTAAVGDRQILQMFLLMDQKTNGALKGIAAHQECVLRR